jgi:ubiquinone/menaquinone biosynthesis C-methylase UbiE
LGLSCGITEWSDRGDRRGSSGQDVQNLLELVSITPQDEVLEIGPGVGRIGLEVAPHCRRWTGADISSKVLVYAEDRLRGVPNARLLHLPTVGLSVIADGSLDVVYAINVFAHLDEIDRWRYVQDSFRVLRSSGRIFFENIDLE